MIILARSTDVKVVTELTKSNSISNFKTDFCKMKSKACRAMLERHALDCSKLWITRVPKAFEFVEYNCSHIKTV